MRKFILIAEDDADDRFLLRTAFEERGYDDHLIFVENGIELMNYLGEIQNQNAARIFPEFILLDLNMPKMDGREVLQKLKEHKAFKSIPVVVYSTTKNEGEMKKCYELGADLYIVKPSRFDSLLQTVDDLHSHWSHPHS